MCTYTPRVTNSLLIDYDFESRASSLLHHVYIVEGFLCKVNKVLSKMQHRVL